MLLASVFGSSRKMVDKFKSQVNVLRFSVVRTLLVR